MSAGFAYGIMAGFEFLQGQSQANSIRDNARLTEGIQNLNAHYIDIDAREAERFGYTESARYASVVDSTIADQKASFVANGVDVNSETAQALMAESKLNAFLNTLDIHKQARAAAKGLKVQASNVRLGVNLSTLQTNAQADAVKTSSTINAARTGISAYERFK